MVTGLTASTLGSFTFIPFVVLPGWQDVLWLSGLDNRTWEFMHSCIAASFRIANLFRRRMAVVDMDGCVQQIYVVGSTSAESCCDRIVYVRICLQRTRTRVEFHSRPISSELMRHGVYI